jgi:flagella basal body P-ring formation protein FlgA
MKKFFLFFTLSCSVFAQEAEYCKISTSSRLIFTKNNITNSWINETNCDSETVQAASKILYNSKGEVNQSLLNELLHSVGIKKNIELTPFRVSVKTLVDLIDEKWNLGQEIKIKNIVFVGQEDVLKFSENNQITLDCEHCSLMGDQSVQIKTHDILTGATTSYWARGEVLKKISVYTAKSDINAQLETNITEKLVRTDIYSSKPEIFLTNISDLRFHRLNRSLRTGDILKSTDISPLTLIKAGSRVKIKIENKSLNLSSSAMANKSGVFGDTIELINVNSKKKILGKITDFNTVVVEL